MAKATELPELVGEFVDLSKQYLVQETIEPAKQLGRFAGFTAAAALAFSIGVFLLSIAGLRWLVDVLPEGPNWEAIGYLIAVAALGVVAAIIIGLTARESGS